MSSTINDYNKWTRDFSGSFSSSSQKFLNFYPAFESMIDEYFENYSLLPPYENRTNDFLYRFVPDIASRIYRHLNLKDDALELSVSQLLKILNLCVFLSEQCDFKLNKTMKLILDQKQNIYKYNDQLFLMLCELFVSFEYFQRLISRCRDCKPKLKNLSLVFSIRSRLINCVDIDFYEILQILPDFINQFKGDSIRTIETNKLNKIFQKHILPTFPKTAKKTTIDFSPFFHFCQLLISSGNLEKQLLGINFLNSYLNNSAKDIESFKNWAKNSSESHLLFDYLTQTPDLHVELIKLSEPLLTSLSASKIINIDHINQIFLTASKMGKEESDAFYQILIKCLIILQSEGKNEELIKNFIDEHKESSDLLVAFILNKTISEKYYSIEINCIDLLIENKALNEMMVVIKAKPTKLIYSELMKVVEKNRQSESIQFDVVKMAADTLSILIDNSNYLRSDFGDSKEFINKAVSTFSFPGHLSYLYSILGSYYIKSKKTIEIEVLPEIMEINSKANNDDFWNFLIKVIQTTKKYSLSKDVVLSLFNTIGTISDDYFPISTPSFIEFFRLLFILKSYHDYNLNGNLSYSLDDFQYRKMSSNSIPILIKLYFSTNEHELMNSFMLEFLTKYSKVPVNDAFNVLTKHFIPRLNDSNNTLKYYIIKLIYDVLTTAEEGIYLEDYSTKPQRRHCQITSNFIELKLYSATKEGKEGKLVKTIHTSAEVNCDVFLERVRTIWNDPKATAKYISINLCNKTPLKNCSVQSNCNIIVNGNYKPSKTSILSLMLTESNATLLEPLFKILKNVKTTEKEDSQLAEIVSQLLQFLPSYKELDFDLSKCENYFVLIYSIQNLASSSEMDEEKIKSLVTIFNSRKYKQSDFYIIQILIRFFDKEKLPKHLNLLIDPLFECINNRNEHDLGYDIYNLNSKNNSKFSDLNHILLSISDNNNDDENELSTNAIQLLLMLADLNEDSGNLLQKKVDQVVLMSLNANQTTVRNICNIIFKITDLTVFFSAFCEKTPSQSKNNDLIFRLFHIIWKELYENKKISEGNLPTILFKKCIEWIDFSSTDISRLCQILRETVKFLLTNKDSKAKLEGEVIEYLEKNMRKLFDIIFINDDQKIISSILDLSMNLIEFDTKFNAKRSLINIVDKLFLDLFSKAGKSHHYNMSVNKYPATLFTGLQNLGSTCFINTIIQPLFYTYQFRYNILFNHKDSIMHKLFSQMLVTQRGYIKMENFVSQFEKDIETKRQQDCIEYLLILMEKLDKDSYNLFKGILIDYFLSSEIKNEGHDEDFIHLSLNVQKFNNLEDSLKSLFDSSIVMDHSLSLSSPGGNNNTEKFSRIKKAPQFLIIGLNRFEYNLKTYQKIKINSKFSFPFTIDISEYVEEKPAENENDVFTVCKGVYKYELYAVSLHNGSGDSGHYTALVKINGKWIEFNDRSSREIKEEDVKTMSFGTDNRRVANSERNAYVLYYRRILLFKEKDSPTEKTFDLYNESTINQVFKRFSEKIEKEEHLCLFNDENENNFKDYSISTCNSNLEVLVSYFFNVFCHSASRDSKEYIQKMIQKVDELEAENKIVKGDSVYNFIIKNSYYPKLIEIFKKCKIEQILVSLRHLLINYSENPNCKVVLTNLISSLSSFCEKPEKIDSVTPLFLNYLIQSSEEDEVNRHCQIAREMNWEKKILEFFDFCSKKLSESNQRKMRVSDLLNSLKLLVLSAKDDNSGKAKAIIESIQDSIRKNHKFLLMNSFNSFPLLDLYQSICSPESTLSDYSIKLIKMIEESNRSDVKNKLIMNYIIGLIECDSKFELISDSLNYASSKFEVSVFFKDYLRTPNNTSCFLQEFLVNHYDKFILPELLHKKKETRLKAEHLTYDIFIDVKPPSNSPQYSNSRSTQNRSGSEIMMKFLRYFNEKFFEKVNEYIDEFNRPSPKSVQKGPGKTTITVTYAKKEYDSYLFENFLRVLKWTVKRVKSTTNVKQEKSILIDDSQYPILFSNIYKCFEFIDSRNSRTSKYGPDSNFKCIIDVFKVFPFSHVLSSAILDENINENEHAVKIRNVAIKTLDFVPTSPTIMERLSKMLLMISTVRTSSSKATPTSSNNLLLNIYEDKSFVLFFKTVKKLRQDDTQFDKFYSSTLPTVLENSELYRKESLIILDNPLNFFLEYPLLTMILDSVFHLLPAKFIIKVFKWVIKCINNHEEPPSFMEAVLSINSSVKRGATFESNNRIPFEELFIKSMSDSARAHSSLPVSAEKLNIEESNQSIDKDCELLKSFDNIGYKNKMKFDDSNIYFNFIKYICRECLKIANTEKSLSFLSVVPDEILMKLMSRMSLIEGRNVGAFQFEINSFFDLAYDFRKFVYISHFVMEILPLSDLSIWLTSTKVFDLFLKMYKLIGTAQDSEIEELEFMIESLFNVVKSVLSSISISGNRNAFNFIVSFLNETSLENFKSLINNLVVDYDDEKDPNKKKYILDNLRKIIRTYPKISDFTKTLINL